MIAIEPLVETIQRRYDLSTVEEITPLTGGEWKTLWRLRCGDRGYVVSVSHPTTTEESIAYEHRLLHYLQRELAEVPAPYVGVMGSTYFTAKDRFVSLLPLMSGEMPDNIPEGEQLHLVAARFLARFHQVSVAYPDLSPRPTVPAWHNWHWHAATWPVIQAMLSTKRDTSDKIGRRFWDSCGEWAAEIAACREQIENEWLYFRQWISDLVRSEHRLTTGIVHDDYHDNNLLMTGAEITALLDWDGAHPDWLLFDVSNALWEFCSDDETHTLELMSAAAFQQAYSEAGGPLQAAEFSLIIPFIRCRRMIEILGSLYGIATATAWDESPDYLVHNLRSLENLHESTR